MDNHHNSFKGEDLYKLMYKRKFTYDMLAEELNVPEIKIRDWIDGKVIPTKYEQELLNETLR